MNKINAKVVKFKQEFDTSWMLTEWLRYRYNSSLHDHKPDKLISLNELTKIKEEIVELADKQKQIEIKELAQKLTSEYEIKIANLYEEIERKQNWIDKLIDKYEIRDLYLEVEQLYQFLSICNLKVLFCDVGKIPTIQIPKIRSLTLPFVNNIEIFNKMLKSS